MATMQSQQRPEMHSRSKSAFSFRSRRSSDGAEKVKLDLTETEKDRRRSKFSGKTFANPNKAVQEAEPTVQAQEGNTLSSIRGVQHKDWQGNLITDPDASNPARSKLERPLDTIRSFEAAVEGGHTRRLSSMRNGPEPGNNYNMSSRRSSVIGTDININPRSSYAIPGSDIPQAMTPRRQMQRDPYDPYGRNTYPRRSIGPRMQTAPGRPYSTMSHYSGYDNGPNGYGNYGGQNYGGHPYHNYNDSYDTNADSTGSPSEPWGTSTDPSSENSSVDRIHAAKYSEGSGDAYGNAYGGNGGYQHGPPMGRASPMPMRPQRQTIAEESWNEDRGLHEGTYDYQGPPHHPGVSYQQQRPSPPRDIGNGNRGPYPPAQPQQAPYPQQPQQQPAPFQPKRNVIALDGASRDGPYPGSRPQPSIVAPAQPHARSQRSGTLRKQPSEKKKGSWLKRRFSKG